MRGLDWGLKVGGWRVELRGARLRREDDREGTTTVDQTRHM